MPASSARVEAVADPVEVFGTAAALFRASSATIEAIRCSFKV
jgi:hypothetical protein